MRHPDRGARLEAATRTPAASDDREEAHDADELTMKMSATMKMRNGGSILLTATLLLLAPGTAGAADAIVGPPRRIRV